MTFDELLDQVCDLLKRQERVSYRALKIRFQLASPYRGSPLAGQVVGAAGRHELESPLAAAGQACGSAGVARTHLKLVHRGLRHPRPPGGQGIAGEPWGIEGSCFP
jgi:hypothetical protein